MFVNKITIFFCFDTDTSPLMSCFNTIDPKPFNQMCIKDMELMKNRADKRTGVCPTAAAYIEQCRSAGVELWMPAQCVYCKQNDVIMRNGESARYQHGNTPTKSVDVVFIVQQSQCLSQSHLEDLPLLIDRY